MPAPKLIVTAPLLSVSRNVPVAAGTNGAWRALAVRATMDAAALGAVRGARGAKAEVVAVLAVEPALAATVRAEVEALGATADLVEVGSASLRHSRYVGEDGTVRFEVVEGEPPSAADVDRLLDRVGARLEESPALTVVAGDLDGGPRRDYAERVVGRAWGLGVRTVLVPNGPSLKQAFHTQPLAAWAEASELAAVSPPDEGVTETLEETLDRIFLDPVRLLFVRRDDGTVFAASRKGRRELGAAKDWDPSRTLGAFAAIVPSLDEDYLEAAERAFATVQADAPHPAR